MRDSDADLVDFDDYVRRRASAHLRVAFLLTGDLGEAEDLVQTVLAKLAVRWERISRMESPDAYTRRALINTHRSGLRRRRVETVSLVDAHDNHGAGHGTEAATIDRLDLVTALARLPARQRATVILRFYADLSEPETAQILECSVGTVKSQTAKALAKLRNDPRVAHLVPEQQEENADDTATR